MNNEQLIQDAGEVEVSNCCGALIGEDLICTECKEYSLKEDINNDDNGYDQVAQEK